MAVEVCDYYPTVAFDFDGTVAADGAYPKCGPAIWPVINALVEKRAQGFKLILYTCREGEALENAVEFCIEHGIEPDAVNDNLFTEEQRKRFGNPRKVYATEYWDDRAVQVRNLLSMKIGGYKHMSSNNENKDQISVSEKYFVVRLDDPLKDELSDFNLAAELRNNKTEELVGWVYSYQYNDGVDPIMFKDHPLFNTVKDANVAFSLGKVTYVELHYVDGSCEFGYAVADRTKAEGQMVCLQWLDGYVTGIPFIQLRKVMTKICEI
ncbi:MAG: hypothetical protein NC489_08915 [Ruminococcus flavefaciens]|nr:hypothetical protein [Ruminococcus flavefaciens]